MNHSPVPRFEAPPSYEPVSAAFRIGDPGQTIEAISGDKRIFVWQPSSTDGEFSELAGWRSMNPGELSDGFRTIEVPMHTRSATTVLAGLRAWDDEKKQIVSFLTGYQKKVLATFGTLDISVGLDTIGVTETEDVRTFFVAPPHSLADAPEEVNDWKTRIKDDLMAVLGAGSETDDLIDIIDKNLGEGTGA